MWFEYASSVQDAEVVYEYMVSNQIGVKDPRVYISLAYFLERFRRNFELSETTY